MKKIKRVLSLCLVLTLLVSALPLAAAAENVYTDVPETHWAHDVIEKWSGNGVLEGTGDGTFWPDRELTLGELAAVLSRLFDYSRREQVEVEPAWADPYVEMAVAAGVFEPAESIPANVIVTREHAVYYIARAYGIEAVEGNTTFVDDDLIDPAYKPYINAMQKLGYLQGDQAQRFNPKTGYTRASAIQVLENITQAVGMPEKADYALKAGAGAETILFDEAMFPVEGFNGGVHLNPVARVLVLEQNVKTAIVSLELVNVPADVIDSIKQIVSEKTGVSPSNVWVHATHAITTPHAPSDAAQRELYVKAVTDAVTSAAVEAAATFQPAKLGVGTGTCDVNANRDIKLNDSWYIGLGSDMPSNKEMTILRFDALDGNPIAFFLSYGIKPTAIDNSEMKAGTRKLSSDVPGVACAMMEEEFSAVALFCMPAAGDQIPKETALFYEINDAGEVVETDLGVEAGIEIVERLGKEMGDTAIDIAKNITCTDAEQDIYAKDSAFTWSTMSGDGEVEVAVRGMTIGDSIALVGFKPEVNAVTERELWEASPYEHTLLLSFVDGDQKYMPDANAHDLQTWEWKRSGTAKGSAEEFVKTAVELLEGITDASNGQDNGPSDSNTDNGPKQTIQMGGYDWIVLTEQDGKALVVSAQILERRAYHSAGGAVTWENCELRAYLNGEFYDKTFSDAEKAHIVETTLENRSNSQYGIAGGNDTTDKVFLLSLSEAEQYMGSGVELLRATDITTGEAAWWALRSPGEATNVNAGVSAIGLLDFHGLTDGVTDASAGVRPAMWITLE